MSKLLFGMAAAEMVRDRAIAALREARAAGQSL
jgi:hypothetical protein